MDSPPVTVLLHRWRNGDAAALEALSPVVYHELKRLATHYMARERDGHTLQPTALVNEAYLRLIDQNQQMNWESRSHFIAVAAQHMRQLLVDNVRRHKAAKRGSGAAVIALDEALHPAQPAGPDLLALNEALDKLAEIDLRKARVMELKYFGGLDMNEIAHVLEISPKTVEKDVRLAKAWLRKALEA